MVASCCHDSSAGGTSQHASTIVLHCATGDKIAAWCAEASSSKPAAVYPLDMDRGPFSLPRPTSLFSNPAELNPPNR